MIPRSWDAVARLSARSCARRTMHAAVPLPSWTHGVVAARRLAPSCESRTVVAGLLAPSRSAKPSGAHVHVASRTTGRAEPPTRLRSCDSPDSPNGSREGVCRPDTVLVARLATANGIDSRLPIRYDGRKSIRQVLPSGSGCNLWICSRLPGGSASRRTHPLVPVRRGGTRWPVSLALQKRRVRNPQCNSDTSSWSWRRF